MNNVVHQLDAAGYRIIELLEADGRLTNKRIGEEVGLTEGAVRRRVRAMIDSGLLVIVGVSRADLHGVPLHVIVGMQVVVSELHLIRDALVAMPELRFVYETAGRFNIMAVGFFADHEGFRDFLSEKLSAVPGITHVESQTILSTAKRDYGLSGGVLPRSGAAGTNS